MSNTDNTITDIFVSPRTKSYCTYRINRSTESHARKYEEMYHFLCTLIPEKTVEINRLLFGMKSFICFPEDKEVVELAPHLEGDKHEISKLLNKNTAKKSYNESKKKEESNEKTLLDKITGISKLNLFS